MCFFFSFNDTLWISEERESMESSKVGVRSGLMIEIHTISGELPLEIQELSSTLDP